MPVGTGARGLLLGGERKKFLSGEWPRVFATIQRLGLDPWTQRDGLMCDVADGAVLPCWLRVSQTLDYMAGVYLDAMEREVKMTALQRNSLVSNDPTASRQSGLRMHPCRAEPGFVEGSGKINPHQESLTMLTNPFRERQYDTKIILITSSFPVPDARPCDLLPNSANC